MTAIRRIVLVGHTHHDVGYTNSPRLIDRMHSRIVAEVLDLADRHGTDGPDGFRWTFEVSRPLLGFLSTASPRDRERLRRRAADGTIVATAGYLNPTQLASQAELDVAYDRLPALRDAGFAVRTQQHGDVNGLSWGSVAAMRRAGVERLVMALNPDHGRAPFEQPTGFWWTAPDGERVFVWLSTHYGFGEEWGIIDGDLDLATRRIEEFVARLDARDDYPYDVALVHAANDNRWPTALFLRVVGHWNVLHPELPMSTGTIDDALDLLVPQAERNEIPTVKGEWSDWWSHGHGSTAREVAVYREARTLALSAQSSLSITRLRGDGRPVLATMLGYRRGPVRLRADEEVLRDLAEVDDQLLLWNEHTWGSWETYSKPHSFFSHSHWNATAGHAYGAYDYARDLAVEGLFRVLASGDAVASDEEVVAVFNPTESTRTEPVAVEVDGVREATLVAVDVPPYGATFLPVPIEATDRRPGRRIENDRYRAVVDPARGGVVSLTDLRSGRELVDAIAGHGLGAVVVERVAEGSTHPMVARNPKDFHPDTPGPDFERTASTGAAEPTVVETESWVEIRWEGVAPTVPRVSSRLRLYRETDVIDLEVRLEKPEVFDPESIFVAFPFDVDEPRFLLETAGAVYEADAEQLPDTSKDWYSIQHAVGIVGGGSGILWGTIDAPLVQLGDFHTGEWARRLVCRGGHVNSWLMNNLHFTNFQARQDGTGRYRYRFRPADGLTKAEVQRFGRDLLRPLHARVYRGPQAQGPGGLRVSPEHTVLAELRPSAEASVRVRLRNPGPEPVTVRLGWTDDSVSFDRSEVDVPAGGFAEVRATKR